MTEADYVSLKKRRDQSIPDAEINGYAYYSTPNSRKKAIPYRLKT